MADDALRFVKSLTWVDVFSIWRSGEANLPRWIEHYQQGGFHSWDEWREHTLRDLPCENLNWGLFEVVTPEKTIPSFLGGPFRAWITKYYGDAETTPFSTLVANEGLRQSQLVQEILSNFPNETTLVGLRTNAGVVILDGMHRCCAFAIAASQDKPIHCRTFIALADYRESLPELGSAGSPT